MRRFLLALILCFVTALPAAALDVPKPTGYVTDLAGMLSSSTKQKLDTFLQRFEASDSTQIVVLTIPSLEGESLEDYSMKVAEAWKIGQKDKDNGALLLISRDDHKIRIEVGYGLEGTLTDLLSGRIIANEITPAFRAGDYDQGVVAGVVAMADAVRGEYKGTGSSQSKKRNPWGPLLLFLFLGPGMMMLRGFPGSRRYRRSGIWFGGPFIGGGGGGFGGGGGGFSGGGGGFGGGGSSGGW